MSDLRNELLDRIEAIEATVGVRDTEHRILGVLRTLVDPDGSVTNAREADRKAAEASS